MNAATGSLGRIWAIALNTFREAVRNRVLYVLVMFAVGLMAFSIVLGELSLHEEVRVMKDVGLAGLSLVSVVIALFLGVNLLSKELDKKTVYFVIPKPLHRWEFLVGKYVGLVVTLALALRPDRWPRTRKWPVSSRTRPRRSTLWRSTFAGGATASGVCASSCTPIPSTVPAPCPPCVRLPR